MPYIETTYEVQGHTFTLCPSSEHYREVFRDHCEKRRQAIAGYRDVLERRQAGEDVQLPPPPETGSYYWDAFRLLTDGPHEKIDREHFNDRVGEAVISDFFPAAETTMIKASGFLR